MGLGLNLGLGLKIGRPPSSDKDNLYFKDINKIRELGEFTWENIKNSEIF